VGHGYCLGRDVEKASAIAVIDALRQRDSASVHAQIIDPLDQLRTAGDALRRAETAATKVDFFTMVRGDD
jgi:alpha-D-ribose 1-methylphosphonate 5-triphosphate synthase subunit PhnG